MMITPNEKPETIDEYISAFPEYIQVILEKIRQTIRGKASDTVESISYGMPVFKLDGKPLVYFAAWKNHIGFYPTPSGTEAFKEALSAYKSSKGAVQFPLNKPIPYDLIEKIVLFRMKENRNQLNL
ncbi:MAG: iron chaperone [Armatimonadota bacterium]